VCNPTEFTTLIQLQTTQLKNGIDLSAPPTPINITPHRLSNTYGGNNNTANEVLQRQPTPNAASASGGIALPTNLQEKYERHSGFSLSDVRVYYNSEEPAKLGALAYARGNQIHIAPGQEQHLPHEIVHVIQQKQGIVHPTGAINGVAVNADAMLENDAQNQRFAPKISPVVHSHELVIQCCYACHIGTCHLGENCGADSILARHRALLLTAPPSIVAARRRVAGIIGATYPFGFQNYTYAAWLQIGRFTFDSAIRRYMFTHAPREAPGGWVHCPYCGYEYHEMNMQIDHIVPWETYATRLSGQTINNMRAADVYAACNDPDNLVLACRTCNVSKSDTLFLSTWLPRIRARAVGMGGFRGFVP